MLDGAMPENKNSTTTVGSRIRLMLEANGIRPAQLARAIGVDKQRVSAWLRDIEGPGGANLLHLAAFLNVEPAWILWGRTLRPPESELPPYLKMRQESRPRRAVNDDED